MKKSFVVLLALMLLVPALCWGAAPGACTQTRANYEDSGVRKIIFACTGSAADGSIPNTATSSANAIFIKGYWLYQVDAYPTAGGTAPDAADVFILDVNGLDLLGSVDGSTTAYHGLNLIDATLPRATSPDLYTVGQTAHASYEPFVSGALTLKVANQATASANYTVVLSFKKQK